jgi:transposase
VSVKKYEERGIDQRQEHQTRKLSGNPSEPMSRKPYPTDLKAQEWQLIEPLLPPPSAIGSPRQVDLREILNAIFYVVDNGIKWRAMPHDFPPWQTVYDYYRRWVKTGRWSKINQALATCVREAQGRDSQPSLILIDSQSVKLGEKGGPKPELMTTRRSKVASVI